MLIGYTGMVLAFLMVYFGVRSYRDNVAGGRSVLVVHSGGTGDHLRCQRMPCVATWQFITTKYA